MRTKFSGRIGVTLIAALFVFFSFGVVVSSENVRQPPLDLPALEDLICTSYLAYDLKTQETLVGYEENTRVYPASMTKVMTAALVLEYLPLNQECLVSQTALEATTSDSSLMGLGLGEQVTVVELLYGLLLPSGNDAANVLAEAVVDAAELKDAANPERPKLELFADLMNRKAFELGLSGTNYVNAHGLHDENHYTTAMDLVKVFEYAMSFEPFLQIISSDSHAFLKTNLHPFDGWLISRNTNYLLEDPWILGVRTNVARVLGGKTGTTSDAGSCLIMLTEVKNDHPMISVITGVPPIGGAYRMATFMASLINEGADLCWKNDPVVRIPGTVVENEKENYSADWDILLSPSAETATQEQAAAVPQEATGDAQIQETQPSVPQASRPEIDRDPGVVKRVMSFVEENPTLLITGFILIAGITASAFILRQLFRSRKGMKIK